MPGIDFRNLDTSESFGRLRDAERPQLAGLLTADRLAACEVPIGAGLVYNYAAMPAGESVLALLQGIADEQQLVAKYREILDGATMNTGEGRMVLHHLCRGQLGKDVAPDGRNLREFYEEQRGRFGQFARDVHDGSIAASGGGRFTSIVQVGIGGSDLGPRALFLALLGHEYEYAGKRRRGPLLETRFISNVDPDDAAVALSGLDPQSTLFIVVSKSGTTQETLTNEALAIRWLQAGGVTAPKRQIVAVTSETSPMARSADYLDSFFIDDFIGGRYSSTSAVGGTVLSLAYGPDLFEEILAGAHEADRLALEPAAAKNAALLDALLGLYERNVLGLAATAVLPYSQALIRFPAHLQQLDMESNGKQVNRDGAPVTYQTGPLVFGEPGTNGQHSFYQLLHQGTTVVPLQFIGFRHDQCDADLDFDGSSSQSKLTANLVAQIVAFALGKSDENPNKNFPGERPSSLIHGDRLTPASLGALLAHFENKVMFQGLAWNINSFDQEGVQLGKLLTKKVLAGGGTDPVLSGYARLLGLPG
jgi:glucose-6-phosphate isomerase